MLVTRLRTSEFAWALDIARSYDQWVEDEY